MPDATVSHEEQCSQEDHQVKSPVVITNLHKAFGELTVLNGINLNVKRGETLAVLGRSGTGKSVLLKLIIGLQTPDSGSICVAGEDITKLKDGELNSVRTKIGFLFQQAALYDSLTVEQNVRFPLQRHSSLSNDQLKNKARELLRSVGMEEGMDRFPSQISGGMQKRVGLARALALDPEILLFDEPTAGLDPITASEIGKLIVELKDKHKITGIVVTHDVRGAKVFADRVVLLDKGAIMAEGTFEDLEHNNDPFVAAFMEGA
jgi:phospholipid/cholesterol/gamma-HCH transport system ATP-binding protein